MNIENIEFPELTQKDLETYFQCRREIVSGWPSRTNFMEDMIQFVRGLIPIAKQMSDAAYESAVSNYVEGVVAMTGKSTLSAIENAGVDVRAAVRAGWITAFDEEAVDDMRPGDVIALQGRLKDYASECLSVPPE